MRLGQVIGRVTLSATVSSLEGARWLIVSPHARETYQQGLSSGEAGDNSTPPKLPSKEPSLVVYDNIGAGVGQIVGFVEGREAACPFEKAPPIDAINAALVDEIFYNPFNP
jgi:carbon dioxide concentrating mechanism protein CcmL